MKLWPVALGVALSACATSRPSPSGIDGSDAGSEVASYLSQIDQLLAALLSSGPPPQKPDCDRACSLQAAVCDLSGRICAIAGRHPDDSDLAARCAEGQTRCRKAADDLRDACACPAPTAEQPRS